MKRILYVATNNFNKFGGGPQAVRAYLDSVIDLFGVELVDIMIGDEYVLLDEYKSFHYVKVAKRTRFKSYIELFKGYIERWTSSLYTYLKKSHDVYEMVIINSSRSGIITSKIKKLGLKVVTIHHNDEVEYCMDNKTFYTFGGRIPFLVNRHQRHAYKHSDINLFLTIQDYKFFINKYGKNNQVNKILGVYDYKSSMVKYVSETSSSYHIGISGSLSDYQTVHGINNLEENYFFIINELIPDLRMLITGRSPSNQILQFADRYPSSIKIIPSPDDILKMLQLCSIYLCPTDIGGGIKLRIMDGLKLGLPILTHKVSARGYDAFYDKPYFKIYCDSETFRQGLEDLLLYIKNNKDFKNIIRSDYYSFFGYKAGTDRLKEYLHENLNNYTDL